MNRWQRWVQAPQTLGLRKLLFQVHLWLGIGFGLYVLAIALSGSAILLKSPAYVLFEPRWAQAPDGAIALEGEALEARMAEVYAGYELGFMSPPYEPGRAVYIVLNKDGEYFPHYFNQFTGEDNGAANPWPVRSIEWLASMHADLFLGPLGRRVNGAGGALFVLMSVSGIVLWWQGRARWYEGLLLWSRSKRSLLWQLHSFIGFWTLLLMIAWGVSGFQIGFPRALDPLIDWFDADLADAERPTGLLRFFRNVHFARYGEGAMWAQWTWILVSFAPTLMFISGLIVWWKRVVRRKLQKAGA
ncbi:MAG: hypothetical protein RLZZ227_1748 [Pseudomonadota bacterium]|jgi:uncharacterized iron-regulated membrane protein